MKIYIILLSIIGLSCKNTIEPIVYGKSECDNCKMTIVDKQFASAFMNSHGKTFMFDDVTCMKKYIGSNGLNESTLEMFVNHFTGGNELIDAKKAFYLHDESFNSPMNGNLAAFNESLDLEKHKKETSAVMSWEEIK